MKKIIILLFVVLLTGCDIKKVEMNHYEIDEIPYKFPLKYKQSNESNEYYHCYQLDKNNKITLKIIDVESMSKRKEAYAFLKDKIYQTYHTEENVKKEVINQIIQISQVIDMNLKIKIIKKQVVLFMEHLRLKIKSLFLVMNILLVEMKNMNRNMNI